MKFKIILIFTGSPRSLRSLAMTKNMPNENNSQPIDFRRDFSWRIFRIMSEFIEGFQFLVDLKKEVSIFGSARFTEKNPYYKEARKLAQMLGKAGYTVVTGGGPGIMEAANRGAFETGTESVGLNIQLPKEQRVNKYVKRSIGFYYFFTRKVMLAFSAQAYVYFPGGFGTVDEFFDILVIIQTKKSAPIPIILVGAEFWGPLIEWFAKSLYRELHALSPQDLKLFTVVDTAEEAFEIIKKTKERKYQ